MPIKPIVWGIAIIFMLSIVVVTIDYCMLLSLKFDFNSDCRAAMLKMENENGLSQEARNNLQEKLTEKGFSNINITAPLTAMQGQDITISVEADYRYNKLISVYINRTSVTQRMVYVNTSMARRVVN